MFDPEATVSFPIFFDGYFVRLKQVVIGPIADCMYGHLHTRFIGKKNFLSDGRRIVDRKAIIIRSIQVGLIKPGRGRSQ